MFEDFLNHPDNLNPVVGKRADPKYARREFKCEACNGSGLWRGGQANQHGNAKCNTCHGRGTLVTSPEARAKARAKANAKKTDAKLANMADNIAALGGQARLDALHAAAEWSEFAGSLYEWHRSGKALSERQVASANGMLDKLAANAAAKAQEKAKAAAAAPSVDLSPIKAMFDAAVASGYKAPKYRAEGFTLTRAKDHSRNPGCLYVTSEDEVYMGKISPEMKFHASRDSKGSGVENALLAIAADPSGAAIRYGQRTGRCSCCGRELTKHTSIDAGIGPICAQRWGL